MTSHRVVCCWTGMAPDGETEHACDRPASGYVENEVGQRWFTCDEHVGETKARAQSGRYVHGMPEAEGPPFRHPSAFEAVTYG